MKGNRKKTSAQKTGKKLEAQSTVVLASSGAPAKVAELTSEEKLVQRMDRYRSLVDIGIALSSEKEASRILDLILEKALETTGADAASISLTENIRIDSIGTSSQKFFPVLRFHRNANRHSKTSLHDKVQTLDDTSIAGYVAVHGQAVRVTDCYNLPDDLPYKFNATVDRETNYRSVSMLSVPLQSSGGKIRGVLQILNKLKAGSKSADQKRAAISSEDVIAFTDEDEELMKVFSSQAAIALENARLTEDIENLFESFIRASVTAIEARDPQTSGHSDRVAVLTVEFARAVHQSTNGPTKNIIFSDTQIRELRYAALLHDFGKIGVRESILSKQHKLYPHEMETILLRLDSARARQEMLAWKDMAEELVASFDKPDPFAAKDRAQAAAKKIDAFAQQLQQVRLSIVKANQPQIIEEDFDIASLMMWINKTSRELDHALLTPEEIIKLSLPKGSLSQEERREIESHVSHTYSFLRQIAWTEDLAGVPDIAHAHHEKCDGSGYPRGLTNDYIPVQAKLMTISDIYDALTSMDRPYKPATTPERALDILLHDARSGKLDLDLLRVFIDAQVFRSADGMRLRKSA